MNFCEVSWRTATDPDLTHSLFPHVERPELFQSGYAVLVESAQPVLLGHLSSADRLIEGEPFKRHIERYSPSSFWDAVFVADTFAASVTSIENGSEPLPILDIEMDHIPFADEILEQSRGLVIWHHQLEQLVGLFGYDQGERSAFRKGINCKRAEYFAEAERLSVVPGVTLRDVIEKRMSFRGTMSANLRAGHLLAP